MGGRACTICTHGHRDAIDKALVSGTPNRRIAAHYRLAEASVRRHAKNHLPERLSLAQEATNVANADGLLRQLEQLQHRTLGILTEAETAGDLGTALRAIREARGNFELLARLVGELDERPQVNVVASVEWLEINAKIVVALGPFPEARAAVAEALAAAEVS